MAKKKRKSSGAAAEDEALKPPKPVSVGTSLGPMIKAQLAAAKAKPTKVTRVTPSPSGKPNKPNTGKPASPLTMPPPGPVPASPVTEPPPRMPRSPSVPERALNNTELRMLNDAYSGTRPLTQKSPRAVVVRESAEKRDAVQRADAADEQAARARLHALVADGLRFRVELTDGFVRGLREGADAKALRTLGSPRFKPEATVDLHGLRVAEVEPKVSAFVRSAVQKGVRYVLLICGKGHHSDTGVGVLAEAVTTALTRGGAAPRVRAFASAHEHQGGRGAVAVELAV